MTVHPLILAGAKALDPTAFDDTLWVGNVMQEAQLYNQDAAIEQAEAVIRSLPNGDGLLAGTHAVLPVEATEEMAALAVDVLFNNATMKEIYNAMVAAHLNQEKGK